jgi:hypothetical protein
LERRYKRATLYENIPKIELDFRIVDFYGGRKTEEPREKPLWQGREPTNKVLNSHEVHKPRIEPTTHWTTAVRGERITAMPPMPP